jgi:hypothetical protein
MDSINNKLANSCSNVIYCPGHAAVRVNEMVGSIDNRAVVNDVVEIDKSNLQRDFWSTTPTSRN